MKAEGAVRYRYYTLVTAIFVTCLITSNIIAVKIVDVFGVIVPAATSRSASRTIRSPVR